MKTRIITAAVGLGVLAVVLAFFDTFLFDLVLSAVCLIAIHEVFSAMGFGKKQWYLYAAAVPLTLLVMLSTLQMVRGLLLPAAFLTVLFYNVCQIAHVKTLDCLLLGRHHVLLLLAHPLKADAALRRISL
jgi:phosphatidate cytidylyltransferase